MNYDEDSDWQYHRQQEADHYTKKYQEKQSSSKQLQPVLETADKVKKSMSQDIKELRDFRSQANQFYDSKIKEMKALGSKLTKYAPGEQLNQITSKLKLSSETRGLLNKVVNKKT